MKMQAGREQGGRKQQQKKTKKAKGLFLAMDGEEAGNG